MDMSLATVLLAAGCLLAVGVPLWSRRRRRQLEATPETMSQVDAERLGLGPKWDPFRPEETFVHRMRAARQQAVEVKQRTDYYSLLGVGPGASDAEIERAFRSRVIAVHPDRFAGDPAAQEQAAATLRQLNQAVAVLRDPLARAKYDAGRLPNR
jgi:molecular chaperone DnaJ